MVNERRNLVKLADNAFKKGGDTRWLHRQLAAGNPYALGKLARLGLEYRDGAITASRASLDARRRRRGSP